MPETAETAAPPTESQTPAEPQAQAKVDVAAPASPERVSQQELAKESQQRLDEKKKRVEQFKANFKGQSNGMPRSAKPAPVPSPAPRTDTAPAAKEADSPTPTAKAPAPAPQTEAKTAKTLAVKAKDMEGKEVDLHVTLDQATQALLRDGFELPDIRNMKDERVLTLGSRKFLAQREQAQQYERQRQDQRHRATETKPASAGAETAQAPKPSAETPPAPGAQEAGTPSAQAPSTNTAEDAALIKALEDQFGTEAATVLKSLLAKRGASEPSPTQISEWQAALQKADQVNRENWERSMHERFDNGFDKMSSTYPELDVEGKDGDALASTEKLRTEITVLADSIAEGARKSGRFPDPTERAAFRTILREACDARLSKTKSETHARQLVQAQKQQAKGQIVAGATRDTGPSSALSRSELRKAAFKQAMKTGSVEEGKRLMREGAVLASG